VAVRGRPKDRALAMRWVRVAVAAGCACEGTWLAPIATRGHPRFRSRSTATARAKSGAAHGTCKAT
jgi:hypothetical protein